VEKSLTDGSNLPTGTQIPNRSLGIWVPLALVLAGTVALLQLEPAPTRPSDTASPPDMQIAARHSVVDTATRQAPRPSTAPASQSALIRVNVTPGGNDSLQLAVNGEYSIRVVDSMRELFQGHGLSNSTVEPTKNGLKIGQLNYAATRLEVVPKKELAIRVNGHLYRGVVRLFRRTDGKVSAVNVLPVEEYLASVVDSEMPASFPEAARQAQAIVARTYALYQQQHADPASVYDLFASQRSQKYLGVEYTDATGRRLAGESASSRGAVSSTRGIVCQHQGQLFCTYYSAACGGRTTNGSELFEDAAPILKSVPCEWCRDSNYYRWSADIGQQDLLRELKNLRSLSALVSIQQTAGPGGGVISRFRLGDGKQSLLINGVELRDRLPAGTLRSPHFSLALKKGLVRAEGRGHGHGVGFCQWGANGQARSGRSCFEIVHHYYPGAELAVVD
jgi:stage II sporulation protein D (peptidoglycan lytic transglycosylase)